MNRKCQSCGNIFKVDQRVLGQQFCSNNICQKERKRRWTKHKRKTDPDYKQNQACAQKAWMQKNKAYWREYRHNNPDYTERNRRMQTGRNTATRKRQAMLGIFPIAKIDESINKDSIGSGVMRIPVSCRQIAKIDSFIIRIEIISGT
jgi:hypothetical protein